MELNYGMSLEQKQQLSQNQIQSLEVLAMDSVELSEFLQDEYLENPLLDYSEEHAMPGGREDIGQTYEQPPVLEQNYDDTAEEEDRRRKDIPMPETESIKNYILEQLPDGACSRKLAEFMTDCLDDNGFFTIPAEEVAQKTGVPEAEVSWTLKVLQELEPYGIFAPDLKHSLLKQLEMQGLKNAPVSQVVKEHLQDVADGKISAISRALKLSTAEVRKCIDQIAKLNPRPLGEFGGKRNDYVVPDIIFRKDDGKWEIELNDGWVEDYHINDYYLKMMKESTDAQLGAYFQKKLERIRFVMNSIAQRRRTILQISEQILNVQEHFLDGTGFLKPMTMTDVAESLGIHTSTVSRAIKGKYIQYPCGTILMKHLFTASISAAEGSDAVGTMQIKELMKELIRNEDKNKPYSDQKLSSLLKERGIEISRRAVAKYREELGIRGSFDRKAF